MADFKTHLTFSTGLGAVYAGTAYWHYQVPESTCLLAGGLCSMAGMLPDLDSNSSRPLRESLAFGAAFVAVMLVNRLEELEMNNEIVVLSGAAIYLVIRFVLGYILRNFTDHRGMFHSIPAALIFGEITFLLASGNDVNLRIFKAGGLVLGYLSHLMLDEFYSLQVKPGRVRVKKSFGTALKIFRPDRFFVNLVVYALLAGLTWVVVNEPQWARTLLEERGGKTARLVKRTTEKVSQVARRLRTYRDQYHEEGALGNLSELLDAPLVEPPTVRSEDWLGEDLDVKERLGRFLSEDRQPEEERSRAMPRWFLESEAADTFLETDVTSDWLVEGGFSSSDLRIESPRHHSQPSPSSPSGQPGTAKSTRESILIPGDPPSPEIEKSDAEPPSEANGNAPIRLAREPDWETFPSGRSAGTVPAPPPPPPEYR